MDFKIEPPSRKKYVHFILGDDDFQAQKHIIPVDDDHSSIGLQNTDISTHFVIDPIHNESREPYFHLSNRYIRIALTCFGLWSVYFYKELLSNQ